MTLDMHDISHALTVLESDVVELHELEKQIPEVSRQLGEMTVKAEKASIKRKFGRYVSSILERHGKKEVEVNEILSDLRDTGIVDLSAADTHNIIWPIQRDDITAGVNGW